LKGSCSDALIPRGPGYENVTLENQVCTAVGALPGQPFVDGHRFIKLSLDFDYSTVWVVSGIIFVF
jgi:ATP-binding cassette subfamily G (WHITE) protein 2 (SNQ2)